jgi:type IV pilus assembly protein PilP
MKKTIPISLSILACILWAALPLAAAEVKKMQSSVPAAPSVIMQPQAVPMPSADNTYNYNPLGKTDPFRPFVEEEIEASKKKTAEKKVATSIYPLQKIAADKFRIVGIGGDQSRRVAIVEDSTKKYYPLFIGTHIGLNNGKVMEILSDRVIIEEYEAKKAKRTILRLRKN